MSRGRKPRADTRSSRRREFRLTESEDRQLQEIADEIDAPVAEIIRDAVNTYVADYSERPKPFTRISSGSNSNASVS